MLDIIRKKASAWGTKFIFGIVILVFVFFFGYNRMSQKYRGGGGGVVARVDGEVISRPEYQLAYENTYKMYQNMFKTSDGSLPEGIEKSVKASTLNQLIQQEVVKGLGRSMDIEPTRFELAETIRSSPVAMGEDGRFDPYLYKQRFLPYFSQKYNMDYERLVADDILFQDVRGLFASFANVPSARLLYDMENTKWTFDVAEKGGKAQKVGPIPISEYRRLFPSEADVSVYEKVFSIGIGKTTEPMEVGGKSYTVKLTRFEQPTNGQWEKERGDFIKQAAPQNEQEAFSAWVSALLKKAKVKTFIGE